MRSRVLAASLACLAIAGCTSSDKAGAAGPTTTSSTAVPTTVDPRGVITVASRFGEVATLDPCGLVDQGTLPAELHALPGTPVSLDSCDFVVSVGHRPANLVVGQLASTVPAGPGQSLGRGLVLHDGTRTGDACTSGVELGDGSYLQVVAKLMATGVTTTNPNGLDSPCQAAHDGAVGVGTVLLSATPMRHQTVSASSLDKLKACAVLNGRTVEGVTIPVQQDEPAGHSCVWSAGSSPSYQLDFTVGPTSSQSADAVVTVAGRPSGRTAAAASGDRYQCQIETDQGPFGPPAGKRVELARITVTGPAGQPERACQLATDLANLVWPKLPPVR